MGTNVHFPSLFNTIYSLHITLTSLWERGFLHNLLNAATTSVRGFIYYFYCPAVRCSVQLCLLYMHYLFFSTVLAETSSELHLVLF